MKTLFQCILHLIPVVTLSDAPKLDHCIIVRIFVSASLSHCANPYCVIPKTAAIIINFIKT